MDFSKNNLKKVKTSEKSEDIRMITDSLIDIDKNIMNLERKIKEKSLIISNIKKIIFDINKSNEELDMGIGKIRDSIRDILLSKEIIINIDLQEKCRIIKEKEIEIKMNRNKLDSSLLKLQKISQNVINIEDEINDQLNLKENLSYMSTLINFRENASDLTINDLIIKPEGISDFIDSYSDGKTPKELLDKIIFLKGDANAGKHSIIKAIGNHLNRPIFRIKYEDYFNDYGLYNIFITLTSYLREQRKQKNEAIDHYNERIKETKLIRETCYDKNTNIVVRDVEGNEYNFDFGTYRGKKSGLAILDDSIDKLRDYIDNIEDSCILYIDNLDLIIQSSKYEKGELLGSIKTVIDDIKNENHDVILMLVGNNLGNNHNDFKLGIERTFQFEGIDNKYNEVFSKIISEYLKKFKIKGNIGNFNLDNIDSIDKIYRNIKFLDKLAKRLIKIYLREGKKIDQELFKQELKSLIESEKSLYNLVGLK